MLPFFVYNLTRGFNMADQKMDDLDNMSRFQEIRVYSGEDGGVDRHGKPAVTNLKLKYTITAKNLAEKSKEYYKEARGTFAMKALVGASLPDQVCAANDCNVVFTPGNRRSMVCSDRCRRIRRREISRGDSEPARKYNKVGHRVAGDKTND
jgi:hypothetical protein